LLPHALKTRCQVEPRGARTAMRSVVASASCAPAGSPSAATRKKSASTTGVFRSISRRMYPRAGTSQPDGDGGLASATSGIGPFRARRSSRAFTRPRPQEDPRALGHPAPAFAPDLRGEGLAEEGAAHLGCALGALELVVGPDPRAREPVPELEVREVLVERGVLARGGVTGAERLDHHDR